MTARNLLHIPLAAMFAIAILAVPNLAAADDEVGSFDHGWWTSDPIYYDNGDIGVAQNVWVDVEVLNLGYHKSVSILWTDNDWETFHEADAWYEGALDGDYERWGVDIETIGSLSKRYYGYFWQRTFDIPTGEFLMSCGGEPNACESITVEYAIKYVDHATGETYWANNGGKNYQLVIDNAEAFESLTCEAAE